MMASRISHISEAVRLRAFCCVGLSVLLLPQWAAAGEWTISPRADFEQSITDNVRSVADGAESDLITTASAGIGISGVGRRLQLNFDYNISQDKFWDAKEQDGFRQSMLGVGNVELFDDYVFLDTRASVSQQSLARNGGESASDRNVVTNDQTTVVNYSITPNYGYRFHNWTETDVRISFNETRFLESDVGSVAEDALPETSRNVSINSLLKSGPNFNKFSWQLAGSSNFTNNGSNRDLLEFSNEYAWSRKITLLGRVGRETIENSGINEDDSAEIFWRGGVRLTPGPRSSFRLEYGERFDGSTFSGDASYNIGAQTSLSASYEVSVQTDRELLTQNLNNLILNPFTGELVDPATGLPGSPNSLSLDFLEQTTKQQNFNVALNGTRGRNTFNLNSSMTVRTVLPAGSEEKVFGFGASINRRIWPDLTGGITANYSSTLESPNGVEDFSVNGSMFLDYRIFTNFNGRLQYSLLHRDSDQDADDLQENVISLSLSKTF